VLLLNECLSLLFVSLLTLSGNVWIHTRKCTHAHVLMRTHKVLVIPRSGISLKKLIIAQTVKNSSLVMEYKGLFLCSHESSTGPRSESDESSPYPRTLFLQDQFQYYSSIYT